MAPMKAPRVIPMLSLVLALSSCGSSSDSGSGTGGYHVTDQTLQGTMAGAPWTFVAGKASTSLSSSTSLLAELYALSVDACGLSPPKDPHVLLQVPKSVGEYPLGINQSITFVMDGNQNYIATEGLLVVKEVTDTQLSGGLYATFGGDKQFVVDGNFTATICKK
jgi:hypothetical protein